MTVSKKWFQVTTSCSFLYSRVILAHNKSLVMLCLISTTITGITLQKMSTAFLSQMSIWILNYYHLFLLFFLTWNNWSGGSICKEIMIVLMVDLILILLLQQQKRSTMKTRWIIGESNSDTLSAILIISISQHAYLNHLLTSYLIWNIWIRSSSASQYMTDSMHYSQTYTLRLFLNILNWGERKCH